MPWISRFDGVQRRKAAPKFEYKVGDYNPLADNHYARCLGGRGHWYRVTRPKLGLIFVGRIVIIRTSHQLDGKP